jgi:hypothetical protein
LDVELGVPFTAAEHKTTAAVFDRRPSAGTIEST